MNRQAHVRIYRLEKTLGLLLLDVLVAYGAAFAALWIRFDFHFSNIEPQYLDKLLILAPIWAGMTVAVFSAMGLYRMVLTFASSDDLFRVITAYLILLGLELVAVLIFQPGMPRSYYGFMPILSLFGTLLTRFSYRLLHDLIAINTKQSHAREERRIMIVGAGVAGHMLVKEYLESNKVSGNVVCFIDDDRNKVGCLLEGIPIAGATEDIPYCIQKYKVDEIIYAIPSAPALRRKEILDICSTTGCKVQMVPGIYQLVNGQVRVESLRNVEAQDLLGREPVKVNMDQIFHYISGKVVMVTGGGGSIGSELCRQIAKSRPKTLIIFDIYENNAYDLQMELKHNYPDLDLVVLIGSVRNTSRINSVIETYRPELLFHAAAHKHVPLMEDSPNEAIKNNVFGTYKTAQAAAKYGVKKFVLISTDKAVNPTNIMGASKRLCEMVVQMMSRRGGNTDFVAVRFGNVLGSNGSVVPLFKKQIAEGGPVTVTHPEITRFFMTIPEAVSLVLQAGFYAKGGEIYVLDMGEPVKIADMARNLIRLSGYEPDVDIKIVYTGLREGEKLYEELLMREEGLQDTANKLIHVGRPIEMDDNKFLEQLKVLDQACQTESPDMKHIVAAIVPTYHPQEKTESKPKLS